MGAKCRRKQAQVSRDPVLLSSTDALVLPAAVFTAHATRGQAGKLIWAWSSAGAFTEGQSCTQCNSHMTCLSSSDSAKQIVTVDNILSVNCLVAHGPCVRPTSTLTEQSIPGVQLLSPGPAKDYSWRHVLGGKCGVPTNPACWINPFLHTTFFFFNYDVNFLKCCISFVVQCCIRRSLLSVLPCR